MYDDDDDSDQDDSEDEQQGMPTNIPLNPKTEEEAVEARLLNLRLGNTEPIDQQESSQEESDEEEQEEDEEPMQLNNRDFKAYRDVKKPASSAPSRGKQPLTEESIKERVQRSLKSKNNRENYRQAVRRNQTKGRTKRRNEDVIKSARKGTGGIFD